MGSYITSTLIDNEEVKYEGSFSLWDNFLWILISFGLLLIPIYIYQKFSEIVITNFRIVGKTGIIRRKTYDYGLIRIESIETHQTILGRIFDYGNVTIHGAGESQLVIPNIKSPEEFKKQLNSIKYN